MKFLSKQWVATDTDFFHDLWAGRKKRPQQIRGRGGDGGYRLAKRPQDIAVLEIIEAVNESVDATRCDHKSNCQNGAMCLTHDLWQELSEHIEQYLSGITLANLIDRQNVQAVIVRQNTSAIDTSRLTATGTLS
jgi:Rrf2 family iron-sulfur cluster assembly transcriptional regulator